MSLQHAPKNRSKLQRYSILVLTSVILYGCVKPEQKKRSTGRAPSNPSDQLDEIPKPCNTYPSIKTIKVPRDHQNPQAGSIDWSYQHFQRPNSVGTLILIPGGPGGNDISDQESFDSSSNQFPTNFDVILIDPRFVGCNYIEAQDADVAFITTTQHVGDIVEMIRQANLTNVVIKGNSYGTVVATELVAKLEEEDLAPKAVIFEGSLDRAFVGIRQEFDLVWNTLTEDDPVQRKFLASPPKGLGIDAEQMKALVMGLSNYSGRFLKAQLDLMKKFDAEGYESEDGRTFRNFVRNFTTAITEQKEFQGFLQFYVAVACREIFEMDTKDVYPVAADGTMSYASEPVENICETVNLTLSNPFDAADHKIARTPIYYAQGSLDPNTPLKGAKEHEKKMTNASTKFFMTVENGGHAPLHAPDELEPCAKSIYARALRSEDPMSLLTSEGVCKGTSGGLRLTQRSLDDPGLRASIVEAARAMRNGLPRLR